MAAHTVASVAARALVLERETVLQDKRISACEKASGEMVATMTKVATTVDTVLGNGLSDKIAVAVSGEVYKAVTAAEASREKQSEQLGKKRDRTRAWLATAISAGTLLLGYIALFGRAG